MSIVDCLRWQNFVAAQDEGSWNTEAKSGVPRYDGEVSKLSEYQFRVRLRQAREKAMDEGELRKLGPLALRLVDGLRGPALQVARSLPVDQLAKEEGTSLLLKSLQTALQPRSRQEARDLYQIGAQQGGVLSRQADESIPSYVLRRKAWYHLMLDMDSSLKLPEAILAEQTLQNSGISQDHQLLVRAAVQGDVSMEKICEELVAQHSRIHESEARRGKGFGGFGKSYKSFNSKGYGGKSQFRPWSKAYHVQSGDEYYDCEDWDSHSQSLGGYEEYDSYHAEETYAPDDEEVICSAYVNMLEEGLDENDGEAAEFAAEILQAEAEAYFIRSKAGQSGHAGFGQSRQFQVQGHLTMEERKARVQQLKAKTQCRKCGQMGHWANDPQCPKSFRKGKGKSVGSPSSSHGSSTTTGSPKSGKGKSGKGDKPRTVYFTINEYDHEESDGKSTYEANMVMKSTEREETADEQLDRLIAQARLQQLAQSSVRQSLEDDKKTPVWAEPPQQDFSPLRSLERKAHLDYFLHVVNEPTNPEWRDAYQERWNEFFPGHPMWTESDRERLQHWMWKMAQGLPRIPHQYIPPSPMSSLASSPATPGQTCDHKNTTRQGSNAYVKILKCKDCGKTLESEKIKMNKMEVDHGKDAGHECDHAERDWRGSTGTTYQWKCKKCGYMEKGQRSAKGQGKTASSSSSTSGYATSSREADAVVELFNMSVDLQREFGTGALTIAQLDKIYERCRAKAIDKGQSSEGSPSSGQKVPVSPTKLKAEKMNAKDYHNHTIQSGAHKGGTFKQIYDKEQTYVKSMVSKWRTGSLKDPAIQLFAEYSAARMSEDIGTTYMVSQDDGKEEIDELYVILDTGCNNTCHGSEWMQRFIKFTGQEPALRPAEGRFRGVGGKVEVAGKRDIPVQMKTLDEDYVPGSITSIELAESSTPLLLSSHAQRSLGIMLDMAENTVYSKIGQGVGDGFGEWTSSPTTLPR